MTRLIAIFAIIASLALNGAGAMASTRDLPELEAAALPTLARGEAYTHIWRDQSRTDGAVDIYSVVDIAASPETIWALMTDCETSLKVVSRMKRCEVIEEGDTWDVRRQVFRSSFVRTTSVFRSDYTFPEQIKISRAGGDMRVQEGIWTLLPLEDGRTRVSYRATSCPDFPVPHRMLMRATRKDAPAIMQNLKELAEQDAA